MEVDFFGLKIGNNKKQQRQATITKTYTITKNEILQKFNILEKPIYIAYNHETGILTIKTKQNDQHNY